MLNPERQNSHFGPSTLLQGSIWSLNFQKDQFGLSTFKKTNLVPQLLFLGQIYSYTDVMHNNTMRLMLKSHRYPWLFPLIHNLHI